jgi:hypothetical protein
MLELIEVFISFTIDSIMSDDRSRRDRHYSREKRGRDRSEDGSGFEQRRNFDRFSARGRGDSSGSSRSRSRHESSSRSEGFRGRGRGGRGGGRGRGRGGGKGVRKEKPEFFNQVSSKPDTLTSKVQVAETSQIVELRANFFKVKMGQKFSVIQYNINFPDHVHTPGAKRAMVQNLQRHFGSHIFDGGATLYLLNPLEMDEKNVIEIKSVGRDQRTSGYLRIRKTREIHFTDSEFLQILNLAVRDAMRHLNLQLVGRDYYDANAKVC